MNFEKESKDITFCVKDTEMLKICENGDFYVKDKLVENDKEVYEGFKEWLKMARNDIKEEFER